MIGSDVDSALCRSLSNASMIPRVALASPYSAITKSRWDLAAASTAANGPATIMWVFVSSPGRSNATSAEWRSGETVLGWTFCATSVFLQAFDDVGDRSAERGLIGGHRAALDQHDFLGLARERRSGDTSSASRVAHATLFGG